MPVIIPNIIPQICHNTLGEITHFRGTHHTSVLSKEGVGDTSNKWGKIRLRTKKNMYVCKGEM